MASQRTASVGPRHDSSDRFRTFVRFSTLISCVPARADKKYELRQYMNISSTTVRNLVVEASTSVTNSVTEVG